MHAKYGRWTPSRTYLPAKTVFVHNTWICVCFSKHGWWWQIRYTGSSPPIFWERTKFLCYNQDPCHFGGLDTKKIDCKPIFTVLAQPQILGLFSRTVKISAPSILLMRNAPQWYVQSFERIRLVWPPNMGGKLHQIRSNKPKQWVRARPNLLHICTTRSNALQIFSCELTSNVFAFSYYAYPYVCGCKNLVANSRCSTPAMKNRARIHFGLDKSHNFTCAKKV